jgi:hypothetical protein
MSRKPKSPQPRQVKDKRLPLCGECYAMAGGTMTGRYRPRRDGEQCGNSENVSCDDNPDNEYGDNYKGRD